MVVRGFCLLHTTTRTLFSYGRSLLVVECVVVASALPAGWWFIDRWSSLIVRCSSSASASSAIVLRPRTVLAVSRSMRPFSDIFGIRSAMISIVVLCLKDVLVAVMVLWPLRSVFGVRYYWCFYNLGGLL